MLNRSEYVDYIEKTLVLLCNIPSPSGFTDSVSTEATLQLKELGLISTKTLKNSVLCDTKTNGETLTLAAHLDTLGAIVRSIKSNGRIRISKIGGWSENTVGVTSLDGLPKAAIDYIKRIEEITGVPIDIISTGPDRVETMVLRNPFA